MKGPGLRSKLDVRRLWKCPVCGYERHASGNETTVRCHCNKSEPWMKLVEKQRYFRPVSGEPDYYLEFTDEELAGLGLQPEEVVSEQDVDDSVEEVENQIEPNALADEEE